ncbi:16S rRNA m(7)G-527 methyltransferase [Ekhidna lutea]|uniref:Ribosomal RNA small subunit methyltransferase G n=1 Tax=Ekhidna lutea TaxID=447679 RepID=A0A239JP83_EKHLU|nr:16S rRNA (guanine(527)-N(7))-methyltransferase RsmG [Ekhidna lutea]SNT07228.1 16S rRNA m(7)G-527 methyltransferase [Ekhidna lutea]
MSSEIIQKYFPDLSENQKNQLDQLQALYEEWNAKINVVSRKDIDQLYERHVLHSLAIAKFTQFTPESKILDVGTGGGFPGIPLAILFPDCQFHLVDSIGKKITVVKEVADAIGLKNLTSEHQRMEKVKGTFDFVVSRAVAQTKQLFIWAHKKVSKNQKNDLDNGMILLKGGDLTQEMKEFGRGYIEKDLSEYYEEVFFETKKIIYVPV